jgi:tRNA G18 (ribose-2'-O)-methylase SpoU
MRLPAVLTITDPEDPRIAEYHDVRERDLVGRGGLFIAEGEVVVRMLLGASRHQAVSLLIAEKRVPALGSLIEELPPSIPVYSAAQTVMDRIVGFHIHRGILALGRRCPAPDAADLLASAAPTSLVAVLCAIGNHDNMGGIFRNAAAFGADAVILDADCCDPLYRKAIRVSAGAALTVPFARLERSEDPLDVLAAAGFEPIALSPGGAESLAELSRPARAAILLGAEGPGLPAGILARARTVRIAMAPGFDSLNVAVASGIAMHQLSRLRAGK